jgi:molybdenum cofactor biosynthesis enzyme
MVSLRRFGLPQLQRLRLQRAQPWLGAAVAIYINSNNRNSVYAGAQWMPYSYGPVKLGLQAALITGYLEAKITPVLLPMVSIETQHVGLDVYAVPKAAKVSAAVFATFKVRF